MKNYNSRPPFTSSSDSSSSSSDSDEENYGSDFASNTNLPGFGDFGNFDSDSFFPPPPPHLRRLVAEGEDGGCADAGGCNDHGGSGSGGGGDDDNGHNHNRGYEDRLVDLFLGSFKHTNNPDNNKNNNNGNDDDNHRHPRVGSYLDISDGSGTYSYGRAYLHFLLDALTNHPDTVHVVDGSYFENMELQYRADPKYLFRFASNGKVFARLYVDLPPHTLPPQSSIVDPRPKQDPVSSTICPTCHGTRSCDGDNGSANSEVKEGTGAEENKESKGQQAVDQEMMQCSSEQKKSSSDKKQDTNDQGKCQ